VPDPDPDPDTVGCDIFDALEEWLLPEPVRAPEPDPEPGAVPLLGVLPGVAFSSIDRDVDIAELASLCMSTLR
jgi:hypothetical protein